MVNLIGILDVWWTVTGDHAAGPTTFLKIETAVEMFTNYIYSDWPEEDRKELEEEICRSFKIGSTASIEASNKDFRVVLTSKLI
jgi:hypothetical protein